MITQKFDSFVNFHNCESMDDYLLILKGKQLFFSMIAQLFEKSVQYLTDNESKIKNSDREAQNKLFDDMKKDNIWFNIDYLTKSRKDYLMEETKNGHIPIRTPDHVETIEEIREIHPYLAFHVLLPIPPILNFTLHEESKKSKKK